MKKNKVNIYVFLSALILGILISTSMNYSTPIVRTILTTQQYQNATNEKNKLYNDLSDIEKSYYSNLKKLNKYEKDLGESDSKIINDLKKELNNNSKVLGTADVAGPGVEIVLDDGQIDFNKNQDYNANTKLVHYFDILEIINALKLNNAQAISVNGQRIIGTSEVYCWGRLIKINDVTLNPPFNIRAIGDSEGINEYLTSDDGYLTFLKYRGVKASIHKSKNVKIYAYIGTMKNKFMKDAEKR
ncbi:DUF881 domain-containing protein [Clostridium oryzae]|uniref:Division initiation protein n=1 Tax=Clostridium oryzae TaxID=1450648 RepID=A0A1V4ITL4_9CLOT|nr:DUF881 domain-containing protein [Clostridium oryzae]OPJ63233.1 hypothetical protein CLORY_13160 [Clostridium oryzae]